MLFLPKKKQYITWIASTLKDIQRKIKIVIRLVNKSEIKFLNHKYRNNNIATNILSFSYINDKMVKHYYIGDLIICGNVIEEEAKNQNKHLECHWAHIIIHGTLHLLGYNHSTPKNRKKMESLEISIMKSLNYENPYLF